MTGRVRTLLEMAERLANLGERDLARECVETANKILDRIMFDADGKEAK